MRRRASARAWPRPVSAATVIAVLAVAGASPPSVAQALPAELQQQVDALIAAIEDQPTPAVAEDEARRRAEVVWRWANARSLLGGFVPLNTTLMVGRVMSGQSGAGDRFLEQLDDDVRRLVAAADPGLLGTLSIEGPPAAIADSLQTYRVTYTVGRLPVRAGGRFLIARHFLTGTPIQVDDAAGEGYTTIASSRPGAVFERTEAPIVGPHGGFRGATPLPAFRLSGADLQPGDRVTVTYGDRSGGGPGYRVPSYSNDAVALPVYVDHGDGLFHEFPTPTFKVVGGAAVAVQGFAPSIVAVGERVEISVRSEDAGYNRASGAIPSYQVLLNGAPYAEIPAAKSNLANDYAGAIHLLEARFEAPGVQRFTFRSPDGAVVGQANPILVEADPQVRLYWGETHGHCGFAEGLGSVDGYFRFGRDDARLDFLTLSEHDIWMDDGEWRTLNEASRRWSQDGRLVVYPGYEWTANRQVGGHHNVFYRHFDQPRVPSQEAPVLSALYRGLHARFDPDDVLVIPHAHQAGDWRLSDFDTERLVEIMSGHGTFEWFGRYYLERGFQVGFVGASDDHLGHPGYSPGRGLANRRSNIHQFGGLGGVFAPAKGRDEIFDGLRARRTVATSGAERIILLADLNGRPMGSSLAMTEERGIRLRAIGTAPLARIEVVRSGEVVHVEDLTRQGDPAAASTDGRARYQVVFSSSSEPFGKFGSAGQGIRDNPRGHRRWGGSIALRGARVAAARLVGKVAPDTDSVRVEATAEGNDGRGAKQRVVFDLATRGIERVVELELEGVGDEATLEVSVNPTREAGRAPPVEREDSDFPAVREVFRLAGLGDETAVRAVDGGVTEDRVALRRLPAAGVDDVTMRWGEERSAPGGDWYYVKVTQIDGAVAWTSPWWVGTEPPR